MSLYTKLEKINLINVPQKKIVDEKEKLIYLYHMVNNETKR